MGRLNHIITNQKGGIFTFLLGGIAILAVLSYGISMLSSGPLKSSSRIQLNTLAKSQLFTNLRVAAVDAKESIGDCDSDSYPFIEPRAFRTTTGNKPTGGGLVPLEMGGYITDPWGLPYGYCAWDIGNVSDDAGCGGPGANRLDGSDNPVAGNYETKTVIAMISAGPDYAFDTTCSDYVDTTTDVISTTGDDLVYRFSYQEMGSYVKNVKELSSGGGGGGGTSATANLYFNGSDSNIYVKDGSSFHYNSGFPAEGTLSQTLLPGYVTASILFDIYSEVAYIYFEGDVTAELSSYTGLNVDSVNFPYTSVALVTVGTQHTQVSVPIASPDELAANIDYILTLY